MDSGSKDAAKGMRLNGMTPFDVGCMFFLMKDCFQLQQRFVKFHRMLGFNNYLKNSA